jgi:hypothetical protein
MMRTRLGQREALAGVEGLGQLAPAHELHHDVRDVVLLAEVEHGDDVRVASRAAAWASRSKRRAYSLGGGRRRRGGS